MSPLHPPLPPFIPFGFVFGICFIEDSVWKQGSGTRKCWIMREQERVRGILI